MYVAPGFAVNTFTATTLGALHVNGLSANLVTLKPQGCAAGRWGLAARALFPAPDTCGHQ